MGFKIRKACPEDKGSVRELDRVTVSGPHADLVPKAGRRSGLCQEEGYTELIAYERNWGICHCHDRLPNSRYLALILL